MPDKLRRYPAVTDFVTAIHAAGKPIGMICHGGLYRHLGSTSSRAAARRGPSGFGTTW